jgi:uncharacterized protein YecE (DUF72 family)
MSLRIHIGTSGWHYNHWKGNFYDADIRPEAMLDSYVQHFDTVEINNSFYRLPSKEAVKKWVRQTPSQFVFSIKASRYITHNRKLKEPEETLLRFLEMTKGFGRKLGPILFQLPPSWKANEGRLKEFLGALPKRRRYAFELRNQTWHTPRVLQILEQAGAAFCIFELNGFRSATHLTSDFVYVRLHGPGNAYQGNYPRSVLANWARRIGAWAKEENDVFFYFDNDQRGYAAKNAAALQELVCGQ